MERGLFQPMHLLVILFICPADLWPEETGRLGQGTGRRHPQFQVVDVTTPTASPTRPTPPLARPALPPTRPRRPLRRRRKRSSRCSEQFDACGCFGRLQQLVNPLHRQSHHIEIASVIASPSATRCLGWRTLRPCPLARLCERRRQSPLRRAGERNLRHLRFGLLESASSQRIRRL